MDNQVFQAAVAGLLHDIGKFALRAGVSSTQMWDSASGQLFGHKHALLTSDFIASYVPERWRKEILAAASFHHRPKDRLSAAVAIGDRLSAGERSDPTDETRAAQPRQLLTIFSDLQTPVGNGVDAFLPLGELRLTRDALFPGESWSDQQVNRAYESLWGDFTTQAKVLRDCFAKKGELGVFVEGLQLLLQRFIWAIPSAYYRSRPDISLYDHNRMTAALASLLADSSFSDQELMTVANDPQAIYQPVALLVGGDLSGVQDFIYTISSRGAVSALRGRSFYLQLLTEATARYILGQLDLPYPNLIYASGGHFYLLARPSDRDKIAACQLDISQVLFDGHHGDLYMALSWCELDGKDFYGGRISLAWEELSNRLRQAKQRRFSELGSQLSDLFVPQGHGGNEEHLCQVCGNEHERIQTDKKGGDDEAVLKCPDCLAYEELGEQLRSAEVMHLEPLSLGSTTPEGGWKNMIGRLGLKVRLYSQSESSQIEPGAGGILLALNDDILPRLKAMPGANLASGRRLLVNITPILREEDLKSANVKAIPGLPPVGRVKPFEVMEVQSKGIHRLGVLRMDIDNLGKLFSKGFSRQKPEEGKATLSRVASLSFTISLFFEGWVEVIGEEMNRASRETEKGDRLYSIYSGGDDLFIVGAWDQVVEFARRVRADLGRFTAGHPGVTASAGIALVGGKYPLSQAAQDAADAERRAKAHVWRDGDRACQKDAIAFLGQALPWDTFGLEDCNALENATVHATFHRLLSVEEPKRGPLIRRLSGLYALYAEKQAERERQGKDRRQDGARQALYGPWNWMAAYQLSKIGRDHPIVVRIRQDISETDVSSIEWIGLAARWAELCER